MFSWALHLKQVDSKQPDNTSNFCKASVNHFKWRAIFKLFFPATFFSVWDFVLKWLLLFFSEERSLLLNLKESWAIFSGKISFG